MTKMIAVILSFVLALSFSFSGPGEQPAAVKQSASTGFLGSLQAWSAGILSGEKDCRLTFSVAGETPSELIIRKDDGLMEITMPNVGRLQAAEDTLAMEAFGPSVVLHLDEFREKLQAKPRKKGNLSTDFEMLRPWLEKAYKEIILPSGDLGLTFSGVTVHVNATDEIIRERTWKWIDSLIQERTTLETLMNHYGSWLRMLIPGMPKTFEELQQAWEAEKANPTVSWPDFSVTADIVYSLGLGGKRITCKADLSCEGLGSAEISFLLIPVKKEGFDLTASLDYSGTDNRAGTCSLDLHSHKERISGMLAVPGHTYTLDAGRSIEEGSEKLTARIAGDGGELGNVLLTLAEGRLEGILALKEKTLARIIVEPLEKEPIQVITEK